MTRDNLSPHFYDYEFRCRCGCGKLIVSEELLEALEELRELLGKPIHILSGCRCLKHNSAVGGYRRSQHLCEDEDFNIVATKAADIYIAGVRPRQMFQSALKIERFRHGGVGIYDEQGFIHVDVRGIKARWFVKEKGADSTGIPRNYY